MNKTKIEWVKNPDGSPGFTWNPLTGCLNHNNGLCKGGGFPCYAYRLANGRLKARYLAQHDYIQQLEVKDIRMTGHPDQDPFYPRFWPERLGDIQRGYHYTDRYGACEFGAKVKGIFVCDMSDLFGVGIPEEWTRQGLEAIRQNGKDRFYLLTKQPQNLIKFSPFPNNCWVGVTACTPQMLTNALYSLMRIEAKVKYISFEPLLEWQKIKDISALAESFQIAGINWLIIGAQTKPYKPPKIEWVQKIVEAADEAGIPVFLKDNLSDLIPVNSSLRYGPAGELRLRQEMPAI